MIRNFEGGARCVGILLLVIHAGFLSGCLACGYSHYFEASADGAKTTSNYGSAYLHLLPGKTMAPNAAEFHDAGLTVSCTNYEFDFLSIGFYDFPIPGDWPIVPVPDLSLLWPNYDPGRIEVVVGFEKAHVVELNLRGIETVLPDRTLEPTGALCFCGGSTRDESLVLGAAILKEPMDLRLSFDLKAGRADSFLLRLPPMTIDGRAVAVSPVTCTKRGSFAFWAD